MRAGSFTIYPYAELRGGYTDNAERQAGAHSGAAVSDLRIGGDVRSDWSRHQANLSIRGSYTAFTGHSDLADGSITVDADGRFDFGSDTELAPRAYYALRSQDRTEDHELGASLSLTQRFNRFALRVTAGFEDLIYGDRTSDLGSAARNDVADYSQANLALRAGYEVLPDTSVYLEGRVNDRRYDQALDSAGNLRGSQGHAALAGATFSNGSKLRGTLAGGYQIQIPDDAALDEISALAFEADLVWDATALTRLRLASATDIGETTISGSSGYISFQAGLDLRHELQRDLIFTSSLTYERSDFSGTSLLEQTYRAEVGVEYLLNRSLALTADLSYFTFKSTAPQADYDAATVLLGVRVRR